MKIGIFGGSFNPIHNMHLKIANYLIENKYLDKIIFVPTGDKYSYKTHMLEADKRLIMINLAIKDNPNILSSDYEIKNQMVYTYETLNYFKELWNKFIKFLQDKFFSSNKYDDLIDELHEEEIIDDDDLEIIQNEFSSNYSKDDDLER